MSRSRRKKRRSLADAKRGIDWKLTVFLAVVFIALAVLCIRITYISVVKGDSYTINVLDNQEYTSTTIPFKRGDILDSNGNVLATSVKVYNLILDPKVIISSDYEYYDETVAAVCEYFDVEQEEVEELINENTDSSYKKLLSKLEYEEISDFNDLMEENSNIKGVWFEEEYERKYPYSSLACNVIGFTYSGNSAEWGIEGYYNDDLNGTDGRIYGYVDDDSEMTVVEEEAVDGYTVVSTIDISVQKIVEDKIAEYKEELNPDRIGIIIADPDTGEIIAMASDVTYDLNSPRDLTSFYTDDEIDDMSDDETLDALNAIWRNYCISDTYEPGSTAKTFTVAAALEEAVATESSTYVCDGYEVVGGWTIKCHDNSGHGTISLKEAVAYSCNDALMAIASALGAETFSDYQTRFGFGIKTGIDLYGEATGITYDETMDSSTLATNSFGQNFTVNMVQMVAAFSSLVNGGNYYLPHVAKEILDTDGNVVENFDATLVKQTVTEETSEFIKEALRAVVTDGTGTAAEIDGYLVGGKTGTAQTIDEETGERSYSDYTLSFIGCVPYDDPEVVCYIIMESPEDDPDNVGYVTAMWSDLMSEVLPYLGVYKSSDDGDDEDITDTTDEDIDESYDSGIIEGDDGSLLDDEEEADDAEGTDSDG